jgi:hypothetical protein
MQCERCGAGPAGYDSFDWCGLCGAKLCDECMAAGCCGHAPAISGRMQDEDGEPPGEDRDLTSGGREVHASRPRSRRPPD